MTIAEITVSQRRGDEDGSGKAPAKREKKELTLQGEN